MFYVENVPIPFTHATWRGRFRACRGVGASLSGKEVEAFDRDLARTILEMVSSDTFTVLHQMIAHVLVSKGEITYPIER